MRLVAAAFLPANMSWNIYLYIRPDSLAWCQSEAAAAAAAGGDADLVNGLQQLQRADNALLQVDSKIDERLFEDVLDIDWD